MTTAASNVDAPTNLGVASRDKLGRRAAETSQAQVVRLGFGMMNDIISKSWHTLSRNHAQDRYGRLQVDPGEVAHLLHDTLESCSIIDNCRFSRFSL